MTLVQIDLRRGSAPRAAPAAPTPPRASDAAATPATGPATGLVLGVGLILLVPLAAAARDSTPTLVLLLVGLAILGLIAALLRPHGAEPP